MTTAFLLALHLMGLPAIDEGGPEIVQVGHWLEIRGELTGDGAFEPERVQLLVPQEYELLIGTITEKKKRDVGVYHLLGLPIHVSEKTIFEGIREKDLVGSRVKVEGYWRDQFKFSARQIAERGPGRSRIGGRVSSVTPVDDGVRVRIMTFDVLLPADIRIEYEGFLDQIPLSPERGSIVRDATSQFGIRTSGKDETDLFGDGFLLTDKLLFSGIIEFSSTYEDDFKLEGGDDRSDTDYKFRGRLAWVPYPGFAAVGEFSTRWRYRWNEDGDDDTTNDTNLGELFGYWRDLFVQGLDVQIGRQDFDDIREWLYDENLDAVRTIYTHPEFSWEFSVSTLLSDGSSRDRDSTNVFSYLSNADSERHLAAYVLLRDFYRVESPLEDDGDKMDETGWWLGARAIGDWIPENKSWAEASTLVGRRGNSDLTGFGFDVGTTWEPSALEPLNFTVGFAYATGDENPQGSTDSTYRQTGLQDNNAKFAGVTSFKYYGELLEPELANMMIVTAGVGAEVADRTSLDLVYHLYRQDEELDLLVDSNIKDSPNGLDKDLGWEIDLVLGCRRWEHWDLELVGAWFDPGDAFDDQDDAFMAKMQVRFRF